MADEKTTIKTEPSTAKDAIKLPAAINPVIDVAQELTPEPLISIDAALHELGRGVELLHAFSRSEQRAGRHFDTLDHYRARFNAFCNATPGGKS